MSNGATIWSRDTIQSEIFFYKPDKWFKIWFYIVNRVNHKDTKLFKRGEGLITYQDIMRCTKASKTQVHKCIKFLLKDNMIGRRRTTRGYITLVKKYDEYQKLDNYKTTAETTERQPRDNRKAMSIDKNEKNEKNVKEVYTSNESKIFSYFDGMKIDSKKAIALGKEFDIRPKDVLYVARTMLSKESDKSNKIVNVKSKLNNYINNAIRWHNVATLSDKQEAEDKKKQVRLSKEEKETLKLLETATIRG